MSDHSSPGEMPRRSFFSAIANIGGLMIAAVLAIPIIRAALFPVLDHSDANPWSDLGPLENFKDLGKPLTQPLSIARRDGWSLADANQNLYVVAGAPVRRLEFSHPCAPIWVAPFSGEPSRTIFTARVTEAPLPPTAAESAAPRPAAWMNCPPACKMATYLFNSKRTASSWRTKK